MCSQVVLNSSHIDGKTKLSSGPQELSLTEQELVAGGISSDTGYSVAVGAATAFLAIGATCTGIGAAIFLGASIINSAVAISYANR